LIKYFLVDKIIVKINLKLNIINLSVINNIILIVEIIRLLIILK